MLIADDHEIVRRGLQELLQDMGSFSVSGIASTGEELLKLLCDGGQFDLLLLDLTMPGVSGAELIERIRVLNAELPILVFSMHDEPEIVRRVLQAGATGFVTKGSGEEMLMSAIRKIVRGGRFVDAAIVEQMLFGQPLRSKSFLHESLSPRELQIMKALAQGLTVAQIASERFISDKTVSTHKARLMKKMDFKNIVELARYAVDQDLIE